MEGNFTTFRAVVEDVFSGGLLGRLIRAGHGVCCISLRLRTRRVIILDQIHPVAHFEAPHQCRVKRLQQIADGIRLLESGVKPNIIGVVGQDDGYAVQTATTRNVVTTPST